MQERSKHLIGASNIGHWLAIKIHIVQPRSKRHSNKPAKIANVLTDSPVRANPHLKMSNKTTEGSRKFIIVREHPI